MNKKYPIDKGLWYLDEKINYLNHGSFGATPRVIMKRFFELTAQVEKNPMQFYLDDYPVLMEKSRKEIADFLNAKPDKIAFVDNATTGVNAVLRSLQNVVNPDWEILTTNHYYPSVKNTLAYLSSMTGCKINVIELPDYVESDSQILELIKSCVTPNTKMMIIDHITSVSGIVFPINEIIKFCRENDILILIDGAHAPGFLELNLDELKPDWYTGNLHKWLFAPKSSAILYANEPVKYSIPPTVISNDYEKGFTKEFDWVGTRNLCAWLSTPECLMFHNEYFDWDYCRNLSLFARNLIISELGLKPMTDEKLTGLMQSFWLPESTGTTIEDVLDLRKRILTNHNIEVFMNPFKNRMVLRLSSQIYNHKDECIKLINALKQELYK